MPTKQDLFLDALGEYARRMDLIEARHAAIDAMTDGDMQATQLRVLELDQEELTADIASLQRVMTRQSEMRPQPPRAGRQYAMLPQGGRR